MATSEAALYPVANGTYQDVDATRISGIDQNDFANAWAYVDDNKDAADDAGTDIRIVAGTSSEGFRASFLVGSPAQVGPADILSIDSVRVFARAIRGGPGGGANAGIFVRQAGFNSDDTVLQTLSSAVYTTWSRLLPTNPLTGQAWSLHDFNDQLPEFGVFRGSAGASRVFLTQLFILLTYVVQPWNVAPAPTGDWSAAAAAGASAWFVVPGSSGVWEVQ